jgi:hypothetical protein
VVHGGWQELYRFFTDLTGYAGEEIFFPGSDRFGWVRAGLRRRAVPQWGQGHWLLSGDAELAADGGEAQALNAKPEEFVTGGGRVHCYFLRAGGMWHWPLPLRGCFKFGKMGRWKLFMGNGLRLGKRFKFVSSCFKFVAEAIGTQWVALRLTKNRANRGEVGTAANREWTRMDANQGRLSWPPGIAATAAALAEDAESPPHAPNRGEVWYGCFR